MSAKFQNTQNAGWYRFRVGRFECTSIWDGYIHHGYEGIYPNADPDELARLKQEYRLPEDHIPMDLNPAVVNTGDKLIVIDAGMGKKNTMFGDTMGRMLDNMKAAGIDPDDVDVVLMTHLHPDHAFGLIHPDGSAVFPNAKLYCTKGDWNEWTDEANLSRNDHKKPWTEGAIEALQPYRGRIEFVNEGEEIFPGVSLTMVAGHSLGQCAFIFESEGEKVVFTGDAAHHQVFDPIHPEWYFHMEFDSDPDMGTDAKRKIFDKVVKEGIRFHGYHFPFPGLGEIEAKEDGTYRFHAELFTPRY